ncbi:MAG: PHP domain-containing protein [Calditrichae bacterium]|nr:PHP domain-containing protein [Calditrichia bacterium]
MIDLHMHSTYSDGSQTPEQLILEAKAKGLSAIALTDHDTIDGIPEFMALGETHGITTVPGVEISVDTKLPNNGHMHILGLLVDPYSESLKNTLNFLLKERNERAQRIIRKLTENGVDITMQELLDEAGEGAIGRPHVAKILVRKGVVGSIQEAFDIWLAKGKPAYMDKTKLGESDAIKMIHDAGGLAIMAHSHLMHYDTFAEARDKLLELKELGLDGFEVFYSGMPKEYTDGLLALAESHGFAISGGSDYHGDNKPGIFMGTGKDNDLNIPDTILEHLKTVQLKKEAQLG